MLDSTVWQEALPTKICWITLLAMSDRNGEIQASIPGLAVRAGITLSDCEAALKSFMSPDKYSRTTDDQGRRIEVIEGGWALLNHEKYRAMSSKDDSKSSNSMRQARHRDKKRRNQPVTDSNAPVTDSNAPVTDSNAPVTHEWDIAESDAESESIKRKEPLTPKGEFAFDEEIEQTKTETIYPTGTKPLRSSAKNIRVIKNTPLLERVGKWFDRKPGTLATVKEAQMLEAINPSEAQIEGLERFYTAESTLENPVYGRKNSLMTLLNNWDEALDRARGFDRANP